jgi:hypothetical protein
MPPKKIDYSKLIIYKLVCKELKVKDVYVSTTTIFRRQKTEHKKSHLINIHHLSFLLLLYRLNKNRQKYGIWFFL